MKGINCVQHYITKHSCPSGQQRLLYLPLNETTKPTPTKP